MITLRPKLTVFRVARFSSNLGNSNPREQIAIGLAQEISLGLSLPEPGKRLHALVQIKLATQAQGGEADSPPQFTAEYDAKFEFPEEATQENASEWLDTESSQYSIVAQAFPLAISHFKREMLEAGFDSRELPLGI